MEWWSDTDLRTALILAVVLVVGSIVVFNGWWSWKEKKQRKIDRGFRDMKSSAQRLRERQKTGKW